MGGGRQANSSSVGGRQSRGRIGFPFREMGNHFRESETREWNRYRQSTCVRRGWGDRSRIAMLYVLGGHEVVVAGSGRVVLDKGVRA